MTLKVIIDGDSIPYSVGYAAKGEPLSHALNTAKNVLNKIQQDTGADTMKRIAQTPIAPRDADSQVSLGERRGVANGQRDLVGLPGPARAASDEAQRVRRRERVVLGGGDLLIARPPLPELGDVGTDLQRVPRRRRLLLGRANEPDEELSEVRRAGCGVDERRPGRIVQRLADAGAQVRIPGGLGGILEKPVDHDRRDEDVRVGR